jgi:DNA helicase-2/ATP-dependent DNA helicase PcrA
MEENIMPVSRAVGNDDDMEEERRLMYVAITRAKERICFTRSKSRYLYGKREPTMRSRFLKELAGELDLPKETRRAPMGYGDYDDPESYGNDAYAGGRYGYNDGYGGRKTSFGGGYNSTYGRSSDRENSTVKRSAWNGGYGSSYGGSSYGGTTYGARAQSPSTPKKSTGFTFGGVGKVATPKTGVGKDLSVFKVGVSVKHPKFGVGIIVNVRGAGSNMIIDVAFEGLGIKQLSALLAPLTVM